MAGSWWNPLKYVDQLTGGVVGDLVDAGEGVLDWAGYGDPDEGPYGLREGLYDRSMDAIDQSAMRREREMLLAQQVRDPSRPEALGMYGEHIAGLKEMAARGDVAAQRRIQDRGLEAEKRAMGGQLAGPRGASRLSALTGTGARADIFRQSEAAQTDQQLRSQDLAQRGIGTALGQYGQLGLGFEQLLTGKRDKDRDYTRGVYGDYRDRFTDLRERGYGAQQALARDISGRAGAYLEADRYAQEGRRKLVSGVAKAAAADPAAGA
jgi:hypothetical protein